MGSDDIEEEEEEEGVSVVINDGDDVFEGEEVGVDTMGDGE